MPSIEVLIENLERAKVGLQDDSIQGVERARLERWYRTSLEYLNEERIYLPQYTTYFRNYLLTKRR